MKSRKAGCRFLEAKSILVLEKMLQHINSILRYCSNCRSRQEFEMDSMRVEATVFNLMQLGELAKESLDDAAKERISTIPWHQIYGLRNRIVHGYSGVNMQIVWDTVESDLPALKAELEAFLEKC